MILWIVYIILLIVVGEAFSYAWHRYMTHTNFEQFILVDIRSTHKIHHKDGTYETDSNDFIWLILVFMMVQLWTGILIMVNILPGIVSVVSLLIFGLVIVWNWWLHKAYHEQEHWLNKYEWFKEKKKRHFVHHKNPKKNYGIASNFMDKIFGTWNDEI